MEAVGPHGTVKQGHLVLKGQFYQVREGVYDISTTYRFHDTFVHFTRTLNVNYSVATMYTAFHLRSENESPGHHG